MAGTAQMVRPPKTPMWSQVFPPEQSSEAQSSLFMKKLVAVTVSNITYLRAVFPEHAFGDRCLEDLHLKVLRDNTCCPGASLVIRWVRGVFDALEKKYARMMILGIYADPKNPDKLIESYTFKFSYDNQGGVSIYRNEDSIIEARSSSDTRKATLILLRTILILTQNLGPLPEHIMMTMKLLYYDEVTPPDYEPPGFKSAGSDSFEYEDDPVHIRVGDIETPFHSMKMRVKVSKRYFENTTDSRDRKQAVKSCDGKKAFDLSDSDQANHSQMEVDENNDLESDKQENFVDESSEHHESQSKRDTKCQNDETPTTADSAPHTSPVVPTSKRDVNADKQTPQPDDDDNTVNCACGCNEDDGLMIWCSECSTWQHGLCFLIVLEDQAPKIHVCNSCASKNPDNVSTDPQLTAMTPEDAKATCLWRRCIMACLEFNSLVPANLATRLGVDESDVVGLISRLQQEGFFKPQRGKRVSYRVDKKKVKEEAIPRYIKNIGQTGKLSKSLECNKNTSKDTAARNKPETSKNRSRGQKRVISIRDKEFELCNSQDMPEDFQGTSVKRAKASNVNKFLLV